MISAGNFVAFFVGVIAGEDKNRKAKEAEHEQLDR